MLNQTPDKYNAAFFANQMLLSDDAIVVEIMEAEEKRGYYP